MAGLAARLGSVLCSKQAAVERVEEKCRREKEREERAEREAEQREAAGREDGGRQRQEKARWAGQEERVLISSILALLCRMLRACDAFQKQLLFTTLHITGTQGWVSSSASSETTALIPVDDNEQVWVELGSEEGMLNDAVFDVSSTTDLYKRSIFETLISVTPTEQEIKLVEIEFASDSHYFLHNQSLHEFVLQPGLIPLLQALCYSPVPEWRYMGTWIHKNYCSRLDLPEKP